MNPSLQVWAEVSILASERKLRSACVRYEPSGGGINMARGAGRKVEASPGGQRLIAGRFLTAGSNIRIHLVAEGDLHYELPARTMRLDPVREASLSPLSPPATLPGLF